MKKLVSLAAIGALSLTLVGCSPTETETPDTGNKETVAITHELGTTEVPLNPEKIVVMDYAAMDILDGLGEGEHIVGIPKNTTVQYLGEYFENEEIAHLGSLKEYDMEAINSLEPDLIIIGGRQAEKYKDFSKIAPTISSNIDNKVGYMESIANNLTSIASIFEKEAEAEEILAGFNERVGALAEFAEGKDAIVAMVSKNSVSTLGAESRASIISNEVGFENLADTNATHGDAVSFEFLVDKNPDYMFVLDRDTAINTEGAKVAKEVLENELVMNTEAYKNGNIIYLTPDVWYLAEGGIESTNIMLEDLESNLLK